MNPAVNNLSVLPFYGPFYDWNGNLADQDNYKPWVYGRIYPLITPLHQVVPTAQIIVNVEDIGTTIGNFTVDHVDLFAEGSDVAISVDALNPGVWTTAQVDADTHVAVIFAIDVDYLMAHPSVAEGLGLTAGRYYVRVQSGDYTWYSDMFTLVGDDADNCIKLEWWDDKTFFTDDGMIFYGEVDKSFFHNVLYVLSDIGRPNYEFEEEGEDRDGYFFAQKQISKKVYKFVSLAPEYLCDCLRLLRMADHVSINYNGNTFLPTEIAPTFAWQEDGSLAAVTIEFETNTVAKKIGWGQIPSE